MNTGATRSKARGLALISKFFVSVLTLGLLAMTPQQSLAAASNVQFEEYITYICFVLYGAGAPSQEIANMCTLTSSGFAGAGATASVNLGTANAGGSVASRKKKGVGVPLDGQKEQPEKAASADGGGWGLLVTPQYGKGDRPETDLENGYKSELIGLNIGLDYRFSDSFVLGGIIGQTKDKADFLNGAGSLKTSNNTFALYGTWLPSESSALDGYLGYGKLNLDSLRRVVWGTSISGTTSGNTTGNQLMGGMSASYQKDIGRVNLSPFINLDYIKTSFKGYNETGTTTLEMHYSDRSTVSFTSSLGARMGASYAYDWGTLIPAARLSAVHEFQNNAQQISNELVITPGVSFSVATDAPDRNYLNLGLGVSAALNGGAQLFLDYDKRAQDRLMSSWAVSFGGLVEF